MTDLSEYFLQMSGLLPDQSQIESVSFEEGFSNEVNLLSWGQEPRLILRIPCIDCDAFYVNRVEEIQTMKDAAHIAVSPTLVWHDEKGGFACEFVHQPSLDWSVVHKDKDVVRIAHTLRKAHQLPARDHKYVISDVIQHYIDGIYAKVKGDAVLVREHGYLVSVFETLEKPETLLPEVLCHNDLNPKNTLMDDDKLWFIDWEYSGVGDPLFDLAVVVKSHNLNAQQTSLLLSAYQSDLDISKACHAISEYSKYYSVREMAWLLLKYAITPEDTLSLEYYYEFKTTPALNPFSVD